jgi:hypothetical protein
MAVQGRPGREVGLDEDVVNPDLVLEGHEGDDIALTAVRVGVASEEFVEFRDASLGETLQFDARPAWSGLGECVAEVLALLDRAAGPLWWDRRIAP